jgi:2-keto-4-pentenoate hydratase/2-oxohepta-3-ene-1,7-dioic acid hydratase in catechol pathway
VRIARFAGPDGIVGFGVVEGVTADGGIHDDTTVTPISGHPFGSFEASGPAVPYADVRLLAPVLPSKIIAVGKNYAAHAKEMGGDVPTEPVIFLKPSTSVIGPGDRIALPLQSERVEHEAELAVVISRLCSEVPIKRVPEVILGYTCANDVTARDLQKKDRQFARAKSFDSFCPIGPAIVAGFDPSGSTIETRVNGAKRQSAPISDMVFSPAFLVAYISRMMTLLPGDIILTGTPAGVGPLAAGDVVEVEIEGVGVLRNRVVADQG